MNLEREVFLDTSFAVALAATTDEFNAVAKKIATALRRPGQLVLTTRAVILEIGNALSGLRYRTAAVQLLSSFERDKWLSIVPLSESLYLEGFKLYSARPDKEWGVVDCISFTVMTQRGLTQALTADAHFQQAGFRALLLEFD